MSNSSVKNLFTILMSALFISSCGEPAATELPIVTAASTSLQAATPPIKEVSPIPPTGQVSPTPTDQPFVLPGGRLLLAAIANSELRNTDPYFPWFNQYFWLQLPDMTLEANSYLIGNYPVRDEVVTLSPDFSHLAFGRETYTQSGDNLYS